MYIGSALFYGIQQHFVDELDDRRVVHSVRHFVSVFERTVTDFKIVFTVVAE